MGRDVWATPSRGNFTFETMIEGIKNYINSDPNYKYKVFVGTDAQAHPKENSIKYSTAVAVQKVGKGGQYYHSKQYHRLSKALSEKIWNEVTFNYAIIERVREALDGIVAKEDIVPHVDLGYFGPTSELVNAVLGFYIANGYENVEMKPNSFAASGIADKHSK